MAKLVLVPLMYALKRIKHSKKVQASSIGAELYEWKSWKKNIKFNFFYEKNRRKKIILKRIM
jgi:hypothetical protein